MVKSAQLGNKIRVIRSSMLKKDNKYRPKVGLRYDELYIIRSDTLVDKEKQIHRFRMERCSEQGCIRSGDDASPRLTVFEIEGFKKLKAKDW